MQEMRGEIMTTPPNPKGVVVFLLLADSDNDSKPVVLKDGNEWEYNSGRLTVLDLDRDKIAEFNNGCYLGVAFKDYVKLKDPTPPPPPPNNR